VRAENELSRGLLTVDARSHDDELEVTLTVAPGPGEEAAVNDVYLSRFDAHADRLTPEDVLPPDTVEVYGRQDRRFGVAILYSTGSIENYLRRHSDRSHYDAGQPPALFRMGATWTLAGPWARAADLALTVEVVAGAYPHGDRRSEEVRIHLIRPKHRP